MSYAYEDYSPFQLLKGAIGTETLTHCGLRRSVRYRMRRPWWVCCFGRFDATWRKNRWELAVIPWEGGRRFLPLYGVKTFKTLSDAYASRSYLRGYHPFSDPRAVVVMMHCSGVGQSIVQFDLGNPYDG